MLLTAHVPRGVAGPFGLFGKSGTRGAGASESGRSGRLFTHLPIHLICIFAYALPPHGEGVIALLLLLLLLLRPVTYPHRPTRSVIHPSGHNIIDPLGREAEWRMEGVCTCG